MNKFYTSKLSSQSKSETIFRNRNVQNKFSVRQVVGAAIFGKDGVGLDKFAYEVVSLFIFHGLWTSVMKP